MWFQEIAPRPIFAIAHLVPVDVGVENASLVAFDIVEVNVRGSSDVRWPLAR